MKMGFRTPSVKRSVSARTKGRVNRAVKKSVNPVYGKKMAGLVRDPEKAVYNAVYHNTTVGVSDMRPAAEKSSDNGSGGYIPPDNTSGSGFPPEPPRRPFYKKVSFWLVIALIWFIAAGVKDTVKRGEQADEVAVATEAPTAATSETPAPSATPEPTKKPKKEKATPKPTKKPKKKKKKKDIICLYRRIRQRRMLSPRS